ncbi:hypothetical protein [Lactobacillus psittaci]|uniref:hypothetical protein n=1 Tax=Lactobacillus psittaci TaxID=116089 RepID=UPI00138EF830|nr:hypothetical protein [Lactobacillus psittaci]
MAMTICGILGILSGLWVLSIFLITLAISDILDIIKLNNPLPSNGLIKNDFAFIFAILWGILLLLSIIFKQQLVLIIVLGIGTILFMLTALGIGKGKQ